MQTLNSSLWLPWSALFSAVNHLSGPQETADYFDWAKRSSLSVGIGRFQSSFVSFCFPRFVGCRHSYNRWCPAKNVLTVTVDFSRVCMFQKRAVTDLYTFVERGTLSGKCLAQEHDAVSWPGLELRPLESTTLESTTLAVRSPPHPPPKSNNGMLNNDYRP